MMAYYANFKALPFKQYCGNLQRKITRKKHDIDISNNEFYPHEGHCALSLNDSCSIFFGGAHRFSESTWNSSANIYKFVFEVEDDDVSIDKILLLKTFGACFPPLQGASAVSKSSDVVYVWGGLNLDTYKFTDELYILDLMPNSKCEVKIVQKNTANRISLNYMDGAVPSARCGHELVKINNNFAVLFGGLEFNQRDRCSFKQSLFEHYTVDKSFYLFDLNTYIWKKLENVEANPRAYFSCINVSISGIASIAYIGGCQKTKDTFSRLSYCDIFVLKLLDDGKFQTENLVIANLPNVGISSLSSVSVGPFIFCVGGFTNEHLINGTSRIIVINLENRTSDNIVLDSCFQCAGHSVLKLSDDCLIVCGGRQKQYFVFTSKPMVPGACDLNDTCKIIESEETSPIAWIQCEGLCKRWLHQFCVGVLDKNVRGKYICSNCKINTKSQKKRKY